MLGYLLLLPLSCVLYLLFNPLILMARMKLKFGKAVHISYVPIFGILMKYKSSYKQTGNCLDWIIKIVQDHPNVKIIVANLVEKPILILLDPGYYKHLYMDHHLLSKYDVAGIGDTVLNNGLVYSEGIKWKTQRLFLSELFLYEKLKAHIPMMKEVVKEKITGLQSVEKCYELACSITGEIVIRAFFGDEARGWKINGREAQIEITDIVSTQVQLRLGSWIVFLKYKFLGQFIYPPTKEETELNNRIKRLKEDIRLIIHKRCDNIKKLGQKQEDFLGAYIDQFQNQGAKTEDLQNIETDQIISQFTTLFFGGTDTTGALIANCLYFLSEDQDYQHILRQEIKSQNNEITSENINKLAYLDALLKEVLRLKPSIITPLTRKAKKDIIVNDLLIQKGQIILIGNSFANINQQYYESPEQFKPQRWMNQSTIKGDNGFINIPFSAGARNCIGQHMALIQAKIILSSLLSNFDIVRNPNVQKVLWPKRGVQNYHPENAVLLQRR